jgi:hypothetical protein
VNNKIMEANDADEMQPQDQKQNEVLQNRQ